MAKHNTGCPVLWNGMQVKFVESFGAVGLTVATLDFDPHANSAFGAGYARVGSENGEFDDFRHQSNLIGIGNRFFRSAQEPPGFLLLQLRTWIVGQNSPDPWS